MSETAPSLRVRDLTLGSVLRGVSLTVSPGECLGVLGANGAGKSTLLAALAGVLPSRAVTGAGRWAYLPEGCPWDPGLPVRAWLALGATLPGWDPGFADRLLAALPIPAERDASRLSQGQRVRLGLILTLGRRAPGYLLDDPFLGLDPAAVAAAEEAIAERSADAPTVIAAQNSDALERLCTHLAVLDAGRLVGWGSTDTWRDRFRVLRVRAAELPELPVRVLRIERVGAALEAIVDDPEGRVSALLRSHDLTVEELPLPLREVLRLTTGGPP
jgi:ABC-type multidrug transport system ATPase subunit